MSGTMGVRTCQGSVRQRRVQAHPWSCHQNSIERWSIHTNIFKFSYYRIYFYIKFNFEWCFIWMLILQSRSIIYVFFFLYCFIFYYVKSIKKRERHLNQSISNICNTHSSLISSALSLSHSLTLMCVCTCVRVRESRSLPTGDTDSYQRGSVWQPHGYRQGAHWRWSWSWERRYDTILCDTVG